MEFPDLAGIRPRIGWKNHVFQKNFKKILATGLAKSSGIFLGLARIHN